MLHQHAVHLVLLVQEHLPLLEVVHLHQHQRLIAVVRRARVCQNAHHLLLVNRVDFWRLRGGQLLAQKVFSQIEFQNCVPYDGVIVLPKLQHGLQEVFQLHRIVDEALNEVLGYAASV